MWSRLTRRARRRVRSTHHLEENPLHLPPPTPPALAATRRAPAFCGARSGAAGVDRVGRSGGVKRAQREPRDERESASARRGDRATVAAAFPRDGVSSPKGSRRGVRTDSVLRASSGQMRPLCDGAHREHARNTLVERSRFAVAAELDNAMGELREGRPRRSSGSRCDGVQAALGTMRKGDGWCVGSGGIAGMAQRRDASLSPRQASGTRRHIAI